MLQRAKLGAVLALAVLSMTGCSDDPITPEPPAKTEKSTPKPEETTPRATPSPEPTSTESPEVTAVRRYEALFNKARETGDTEALADMSGPKCQSCSNQIEIINNIFDAGGEYKGDFQEVIVGVNPVEGTDPPVVNIAVKAGKFQIIEKAGAEPEVIQPQEYYLRFDMKKKGKNGWWQR